MKRSFANQCLAILGAFLLFSPVHAALQPGYVVTIDGDTLRGEIDFGSPQAMKHQCRFKSAETGKVTRYTPEELKSFAAVDSSRRFISGSVPYFIKEKRIFLEALQTGRLNLYYTYDAVLNHRFYVSKRNSNLYDLMNDWDKLNLIPFKADYVAYLKKVMVDAPEFMLEIERLDDPSPYVLSDLVGRYNRKFDKSAKKTSAILTSSVIKPDEQKGISISPGLVIPEVLYVDDILTDVFCGVSFTKGPRGKRNGYYTSLGAYIPSFSITTMYDRLDHSIPRNYIDYDYMILMPARVSYHFSKNKLQPMVGIDVLTFLNDQDPWIVLGPSFGLNYTPIKWVSVSCSFQYEMAQLYAKSIRYQPLQRHICMFAGLSLNF